MLQGRVGVRVRGRVRGGVRVMGRGRGRGRGRVRGQHWWVGFLEQARQLLYIGGVTAAFYGVTAPF